MTVYKVVRLAGASYLVWLGIQAIRHQGVTGNGETADADLDPGSVLRDGFIVGVLNPESLVVLTALLPQFVNIDGVPPGARWHSSVSCSC